jgi:hypothetical protein
VTAFLFAVTCLHCGGPLTPTGPSRVHPVEAVVHAVCDSCRAGATLRVLYANRCETPLEMPKVPS